MTHPPLYILRHGETLWNVEGRLQGALDSELTPKGVAQAQAQRRILGRRDLTGFAAISSPQGRAHRTAAIALAGVLDPITVDQRLTEVGVGPWAGALRSDLLAQTGARDGFALYDLAPDGEGLQALLERCQEFLTELTGPSVLVTHGITSRMLRLIVLGKDLSQLRSLPGGQGVVYYLASGQQERLTA